MQKNDGTVAVGEKVQTALHAGTSLLALDDLQSRRYCSRNRRDSPPFFLTINRNLHNTLTEPIEAYVCANTVQPATRRVRVAQGVAMGIGAKERVLREILRFGWVVNEARETSSSRPPMLARMQFKSFPRRYFHAEQYRRSRESNHQFRKHFCRKPETDPFTVLDGRYIGHDGFVIPKNFDEFHERFPEYIRNWVRRYVDRSTPKEDVEDWTQDLLIHLRYLPAISKHREVGKQDIVQTFDPHKHHGANAARFFNYINLCLGNRFKTIHSRRMKNPVCRPGNVSLTTNWDETERDQADDEFCHGHSEHLRRRCRREEKQRDASHELAEFAEFVQREDSSVLPAIGAILATTTHDAAAELLGIRGADFCRVRSRLRQLGKCFLGNEPVPRRRRPYKRRLKSLEPS